MAYASPATWSAANSHANYLIDTNVAGTSRLRIAANNTNWGSVSWIAQGTQNFAVGTSGKVYFETYSFLGLGAQYSGNVINHSIGIYPTGRTGWLGGGGTVAIWGNRLWVDGTSVMDVPNIQHGTITKWCIDFNAKKLWVAVGPTNGWNSQPATHQNPATNLGGIDLTATFASVYGTTYRIAAEIGNANEYIYLANTLMFAPPATDWAGLGNPGTPYLMATVWDANVGDPDITLFNSRLSAYSDWAVGERTFPMPGAAGNVNVVRATKPLTSGKAMFSVQIGTNGTTALSHAIGVCSTTYNGDRYLGGRDSIGYWANGDAYSHLDMPGGTYHSGIGAYVRGDTIDIAVDYSARLIWFRKNGGWWNNNSGATPSTNTGGLPLHFAGPIYPVVEMDAYNQSFNEGQFVTANFGHTAFTHALPSGVVSWDAAIAKNVGGLRQLWPTGPGLPVTGSANQFAGATQGSPGVLPTGWTDGFQNATSVAREVFTDGETYLTVRYVHTASSTLGAAYVNPPVPGPDKVPWLASQYGSNTFKITVQSGAPAGLEVQACFDLWDTNGTPIGAALAMGPITNLWPALNNGYFDNQFIATQVPNLGYVRPFNRAMWPSTPGQVVDIYISFEAPSLRKMTMGTYDTPAITTASPQFSTTARNLITRAHELNLWSSFYGGATVTANHAAGPFGGSGNNAERVYFPNTGAGIQTILGDSVIAGDLYTYSIYIKAISGFTGIGLTLNQGFWNDTLGNRGIVVNQLDGSITSTLSKTANDIVRAGVISVPGTGYYRFWVSFIPTASVAHAVDLVSHGDAMDFHAYGAQVNPGVLSILAISGGGVTTTTSFNGPTLAVYGTSVSQALSANNLTTASPVLPSITPAIRSNLAANGKTTASPTFTQSVTNFAAHSEVMESWTSSGTATITVNSIANPVNGAVTADTITTGGASNGKYGGALANLVAGTLYTFSFYAKYISGAPIFLAMNPGYWGGGGTDRYVVFNISNGTVTTFYESLSTELRNFGLIPLANGWYRLWVEFTPTTTTTGAVAIYSYQAAASFYAWGAMINAGHLQAYVGPTTTTTVSGNVHPTLTTQLPPTVLNPNSFTATSPTFTGPALTQSVFAFAGTSLTTASAAPPSATFNQTQIWTSGEINNLNAAAPVIPSLTNTQFKQKHILTTTALTPASPAFSAANIQVFKRESVFPTADLIRGTWVTGAGFTTNLWAEVDETVASDTDFITSATLVNTSDTIVLSFGTITEGATTLGQSLNIRLRSQGTKAMNAVVSLLQGGTTTIAQWTLNNIPTSWTPYNLTITTAQAATITNYNDLRLQIAAS